MVSVKDSTSLCMRTAHNGGYSETDSRTMNKRLRVQCSMVYEFY